MMSPTQFLLDSNAISESTKLRPNKGYSDWLAEVDELKLYISCFVLGEIHRGLALKGRAKNNATQTWMSQVLESFNGRVVNFDQEIALLWSELMAKGQRAGKTPPVVDSLIAAQCIYYNLTLVTRNIKDFTQFENLKIHSPWSDS